jgi:hypothetical protein
MTSIAALYRYPVKGLTAESLDRATVLDSGTFAGDRVLGLLLDDAGPEVRPGWWPKQSFTALVNTPALARLRARFDEATSRLSIALDGVTLVEADLDEGGRARIAAAVTEYVIGLDESPMQDRPESAPLHLVGDVGVPAFHDRTALHVTVMGRASVDALTAAAGSEVDERRFRMNVVLDGLEPWEELDWVGHSIRIGELDFDVTGTVVRCLATHANPESGERDIDVMSTLTEAFGQEQPTIGVLAVLGGGRGGELAVGDEVTAPAASGAPAERDAS